MLNAFLAELKKRNLLLYRFGWLNIFLLLLAFTMSFIDDTVITGINAWIKPMKFALSITIYSWTFAWLLDYLPSTGKRSFISWGIVVCMAVEIGLIYMQAARGVRSHFNVQTAFDGIVFSTMGLFILLNSLINVYTLILFYSQKISLDPPMLTAWRAGLIFFVLGTISGGIMSAVLRHSVGIPDGGPGIPFFNWSTVGGDIRSAHFITLHGLQAVPLAALVFMKLKLNNIRSLVLFFSLLYFGICLLLHWLAFSGIPIIPDY